MACSLCYETSYRMFDFDGDKAKELQIVQILYKYFPFCFNEEPKNGCICRKCWTKVDVFHKFYSRIEEIQKSYGRQEIQCDTTSDDTKDLIIADEPELIENNLVKEVDNISVHEDAFDKKELAKDDFGKEDISKNDFTTDDFVKEDFVKEDFVKEDFDKDDFGNDFGNDGFFDTSDDDDSTALHLDINKDEETDVTSQSNNTAQTGNANQKTKRKYKVKEKPKGKPKCEHCGQTFRSGLKLRRHLNEKHLDLLPPSQHIKPKPKCDHCKQTFNSNLKLRKHLMDAHRDVLHRCHCDERFITIRELEKHKEKHVKVPCPRCGRMIQSNNLQKHIRQAHEIDQRVVCDLCGRVSSTIVMHKYHVRSDHEVHGRLQCDICKEWYKNKENLRSHMKSIHVEGPQKCTVCGRISTNMKALAKHKKIHEEGSKTRFKCIVCGNGFRDRTKLKEHSYIHTGVTDAYVCQFCGKAFRFGSSMYAHRKKAHPEEMSAAKVY